MLMQLISNRSFRVDEAAILAQRNALIFSVATRCGCWRCSGR